MEFRKGETIKYFMVADESRSNASHKIRRAFNVF